MRSPNKPKKYVEKKQQPLVYSVEDIRQFLETVSFKVLPRIQTEKRRHLIRQPAL